MISSIFIFIFVLLVSFNIAANSNKLIKNQNAYKYWFFGNNIDFASKSNIGSIFSLALIGCVIAVVFKTKIYSYLIIILSFCIGAGIMIYMAQKKTIIEFFKKKDSLSIVQLVEYKFGRKTYLLVVGLYLFFILLSASIELSIFSLYINHFFKENIIFCRLVKFFIIYVCMMYTYIGGYIGVLKTDKFQLYLIVLSFAILSFFFIKVGTPPIKLQQFIDFQGIKNLDLNVNLFFQLLCLIFAISMWFPTMMDYWIRNFGTLNGKSESIESIKKSFWGSLPFVFMVISFGLIIQNIFNWPAGKDLPFYHLSNFIDFIAISPTILPSNLVSSKALSSLFAVLEDPVWFNLVNGSFLILFSIIMLTTIDTLLVTSVQLLLISQSRIKSVNKITKYKFTTFHFLFLNVIIIVLMSSLLGSSIYAGWGTFWASLYMFLCSIIFLTIFCKTNLQPQKIFYYFGISVFIIFATNIISFLYFYQYYVEMHSILCLIYLLILPTLLYAGNFINASKKRNSSK